MSSRTDAAASVEHAPGRRSDGLLPLLGLCPLLAVSSNAVHALGLGLATMLALATSNLLVSVLRDLTQREVRIPVFVLVIATVVTSIELVLHAWLPSLHRALGLYLPLIASNCVILARAEAFASQQAPLVALRDGFATGLGFLAVLMLLGVLRELLGAGTLFAGAGALLGLPALEWTIGHAYRGFLLAALPPGAFVLLALLIAAKNHRQARASARAAATR